MTALSLTWGIPYLERRPLYWHEALEPFYQQKLTKPILKLALKFHGRLVKASCLALHFWVNHYASPRYWSFVGGIHLTSQWIPITKDQLGGLYIFFDVSLNKLFDWTKSVVDGELKRHDAHCDVTVMYLDLLTLNLISNVSLTSRNSLV